jgi:hypothetical protein
MSDQLPPTYSQPPIAVEPQAVTPEKTKSRLPTSALVLGIVAVVMGAVPILSFIAVVPALAAVIMGTFALASRDPRRGKAVTAIVLGAVAVMLAVAVSVSFVTFAQNDSSESKGAASTAETSSPVEDPTATAEEPATADPAPVAPVPVAPAPAAPDVSTFPELAERDLALLVKNPDASVGQNLIAYGNVTQFDAATGPCAFLANISFGTKEASYEYEYNSWNTADGSCSVLDPIVEGDNVKLWLSSTGSYSYGTQIGGNTTVPSFEVLQVELLPATEY